jgi:hypothetical protein
MKLFNPYALLALLLTTLTAFASGYWLGGNQRANAMIAGQAKAQQQGVAKAETATVAREAIGAQREVTRERIRIIYRTIKEQAHANTQRNQIQTAPAGVVATGCELDADGLLVWNAANAGESATLSGEPDGSLSAPPAHSIGQGGGTVEQPYRGDGVVQPMPRPATLTQ